MQGTQFSQADEVIYDDLISQQSMCVGTGCVENEVFGFTTAIYKADDPVIRFQDTSTSSAFPTNDWEFGFTDEGTSVTPYFYIKDASNANKVLVLESAIDGGIALGASSTLVSNAVSVGSESSPRQIKFVANGTDDSDAVNMAQFNSYTATTDADISTINTDIGSLQTSLQEIQTRLEDLASRIDALTP